MPKAEGDRTDNSIDSSESVTDKKTWIALGDMNNSVRGLFITLFYIEFKLDTLNSGKEQLSGFGDEKYCKVNHMERFEKLKWVDKLTFRRFFNTFALRNRASVFTDDIRWRNVD